MTKFEEDDLIGRNKFKKDFGKYYMMLDTEPCYGTDIYLTGKTKNNSYEVEIKKRYISIYMYSGSTLIEEKKLKDFKRTYEEDPQRKLIYFNYYLDNHWIAFDISNRLKYNMGLGEICNDIYPKSTSIDNGCKEKQVRYLSYTNDEYIKDRMCINKN